MSPSSVWCSGTSPAAPCSFSILQISVLPFLQPMEQDLLPLSVPAAKEAGLIHEWLKNALRS